MTETLPSTTVKSAMRTLDIIEYVVAHGQGVVAQDIAAALAIPVSSLSYLLATLAERNYLVRDGRRYSPGPGLTRLAMPASNMPIEARAAILLRSLRAVLNETCSFLVLSGWELEARVTEASDHALRYAIDVGQRKPLHSLAAGKAILAALPEARLAQYFAETERVRFTPATLVGEQQLRDEIALIRQQGHAQAQDEDQLGVVGLACATASDGGTFGAVAIAMPAVRYNEQLRQTATAKLIEIADRLRS